MTLHIIGPRRNTNILREWKFFLFSPLKFTIRTWYCNCPQYLGLLRIDVECSPSIHDQGKMLVLPNPLLYEVLSTADQYCVSFQPILCHSHTQIRIILFRCVRIRRTIFWLNISPRSFTDRLMKQKYVMVVLLFPLIGLQKHILPSSTHILPSSFQRFPARCRRTLCRSSP